MKPGAPGEPGQSEAAENFGCNDASSSKELVSKCLWTHVCLSRIKKGIVTPWDCQDTKTMFSILSR